MVHSEHSSSTDRQQPSLITASDIERICQKNSEKDRPPEAFLLTGKPILGGLLAVGLEFLEKGQSLGCPGFPLLGAALNPDWGFARVEVTACPSGFTEIRVPSGNPDSYMIGDTWGYRFYPIETSDLPLLIEQLATIRAEITKRGVYLVEDGLNLTVTQI